MTVKGPVCHLNTIFQGLGTLMELTLNNKTATINSLSLSYLECSASVYGYCSHNLEYRKCMAFKFLIIKPRPEALLAAESGIALHQLC